MPDLKYDDKGFIPVICQDADTKQILMMAYAKKEQVLKTITTRKATYFSRSRNCEWVKGETSGNTQQVIKVLVDCDLDTLIYLVKQKGNACHTGNQSCFYRQISENGEINENE
ncbi:MAG: phosphoribosyl-AMP cyclohydrolase [Firmicutes bacterium ADurb.Bin146]|jgi:phosphoribosyl-AMP cyclohydrolase|nr:MAG: phosphoribosyl-AMP cyclohydrolase [Firmicutes bacterium ADurb.Bin146]